MRAQPSTSLQAMTALKLIAFFLFLGTVAGLLGNLVAYFIYGWNLTRFLFIQGAWTFVFTSVLAGAFLIHHRK